MIAGIVLAAGASTRFGSPKALIPIRGEPAVAHLARQLREAGCNEVRVVVGAHPKEVRPAVPDFAKIVVNEDWKNGRTGSVKAGVRSLPASCSMIVWPVDHPAVETSTLRVLLQGTGTIRVPTYLGLRGHPALFEAAVREEILALEDDEPLHDVLHEHPARVREIPVDDAGVLLNVDTPDDLKKLRAHLERSPHARPPA